MPDHDYFANLVWQIADLLRGPHRPSQYERGMPPADEEKEIVERVTSADAKLDKARVAAVRTLRLLDERWSALISAAVTGQIDVGDSHVDP